MQQSVTHRFSTESSKSIFLWCMLFIFVFIIICSRRPDILFNAQPWAEDGRVWLAQIYNNGFWNSLFAIRDGYYQTVSRLAWGGALLFGFSKASLAANIIAVSIRCFFILFVLSKRLNFIGLEYRIVACIYYLLMPNGGEMYVNMTNAHWYLACYLMAVLIANDAQTSFWKIHDMVLMILVALSGPFIMFIGVCYFIKYLYQRKGFLNAIKGVTLFDIVLLVCFFVQFFAILFNYGNRSKAPLGASLQVLADIFSYRVLGGTFFSNNNAQLLPHESWLNVALFLIFAFVLCYLFFKAQWRFRVVALFTLLIIGFSLARPMLHFTDPQWPELLIGGGDRYFFVTNFGFFLLLLYGISKMAASRFLLLLLVLFFLPTSFTYFRYNPVGEHGFYHDIAIFESLPPDQEMDIRIAPVGWSMHLKRQ